MKRILFLVLWTIAFVQPQAQGAIEIYADGHKFDSLGAYLTSEKSAAVRAPVTLQLKHKDLPDPGLHSLYVMSVENGIVDALQEFYRSWEPSDLRLASRISSDQLQEAIARAVKSSYAPILLISEPGRIRIMSLSPDNSRN